jgi:hypothetical protein
MKPSKVRLETRLVQLLEQSQVELEQSAVQLEGVVGALRAAAQQMSPRASGELRHVSIGIQAESMRTAMVALSARAAGDRMNTVAAILADLEGASTNGG